MLEELFLAVQKLEAHTVLNNPPKVISEVAFTVKGIERLRFKADWVKKIIGEISKKQEHHEKIQRA